MSKCWPKCSQFAAVFIDVPNSFLMKALHLSECMYCNFLLIQKMTVHQKMTLRVIMTEADIRKVVLDTRPATVEDLTSKLKELLAIEHNCILQYKDPEFNKLEDLPEKPTVKIIAVLQMAPIPAPVPVPTSDEIPSDTPRTADTEILSVSSQERQIFNIPTFSVDVEYRRRQADLLYLAEGTHLKVSKELKHEILEGLAESIPK